MSTPITLQAYIQQGIHFIVCKWEFDETNVDSQFETIHASIDPLDQKKFVVIDLTDVGYVNSKFIGSIADISNQLEEHGGRLILTGITHVRDTLEICGIHQIINLYDDLESGKKYLLENYGEFLHQKESEMQKEEQERMMKNTMSAVVPDAFFDGSAQVETPHDQSSSEPTQTVVDPLAQADEAQSDNHDVLVSTSSENSLGVFGTTEQSKPEETTSSVQTESSDGELDLGAAMADILSRSAPAPQTETTVSWDNPLFSSDQEGEVSSESPQDKSVSQPDSEVSSASGSEEGLMAFVDTQGEKDEPEKEPEAQLDSEPSEEVEADPGFWFFSDETRSPEEQVSPAPVEEINAQEVLEQKDDMTWFSFDTSLQEVNKPDAQDVGTQAEVDTDKGTPEENNEEVLSEESEETLPMFSEQTSPSDETSKIASVPDAIGEEDQENSDEPLEDIHFDTDQQIWTLTQPAFDDHNDDLILESDQSGVQAMPSQEEIVTSEPTVEELDNQLEDIKKQIESLQQQGRDIYQKRQNLLASNL